MEIDEPCSGFWFIKNLHPEWLEIDVKAYREERLKEKRELFRKQQEELLRKDETKKEEKSTKIEKKKFEGTIPGEPGVLNV